MSAQQLGGSGGDSNQQEESAKDAMQFHPMGGDDALARHKKDICSIDDAWCAANCLATPLNAVENAPPAPAGGAPPVFRFKAEPAAGAEAGAAAGGAAAGPVVVPPVQTPVVACISNTMFGTALDQSSPC